MPATLWCSCRRLVHDSRWPCTVCHRVCPAVFLTLTLLLHFGVLFTNGKRSPVVKKFKRPDDHVSWKIPCPSTQQQRQSAALASIGSEQNDRVVPISMSAFVGHAADSKISPDLTILMVTKTAPKNFHKRDVIRNGWVAAGGRESDDCCCDLADRSLCTTHNTVCAKGSLRWTHRFLVGNQDLAQDISDKMREEVSKHRDLILYPRKESYYRLTQKLVWVLHYLRRSVASDYVLLLDDDCYVQVWRVAMYLRTAPRRQLYAGHVKTPQTAVARNPWNMWQVSLEQFGSSDYPPYAVGGGIFMSRDAVETAVKTVDHWPSPPFTVEDAFLGVIMNASGVHVQTIKEMYMNGVYKLMGCQGDVATDSAQPLIVAGNEKFIALVLETRASSGSLCTTLDGPAVYVMRCALRYPKSSSLLCGLLVFFSLSKVWHVSCRASTGYYSTSWHR